MKTHSKLQAQKYLRCIFLVFSILFHSIVSAEILFGAGTRAGQGSMQENLIYTLLGHAGLGAFRDELYWAQVEKKEKKYVLPAHLSQLDSLLTNADSRSVKSILILDYGNALYGGGMPLTDAAREAFCDYAAFAASRYKGKISYYELWNEWNSGMGTKPKTPGSAADYVKLADACIPRIKEIDPDAKVLVGATAGYDKVWTEEALKLGVLRYADGFSVHPYVFAHHSDRRPEKAISFLISLDSQVGRYKKNFPIFVSEMGWPTSSDAVGISESLQADYILRFVLLARTIKNIQGISIHSLVDYGTDISNKEHNFGLVRKDLSVKPAYTSLATVSHVVRQLDARQLFVGESSAIVVKFEDPQEDRQIFAMWSQEPITVNVNIASSFFDSIEYIHGEQRLVSGLQSLNVSGKPFVFRIASGGVFFPDFGEMTGSAPMPPIILTDDE